MSKLDPNEYPRLLKILKEKVGLYEARKQLDKTYILDAIDHASNFYELRALVRTLAEKVL